MKKSEVVGSPSAMIDGRIAELDDWRGEILAKVRAVIRKADPAIVEEWKWNVPVWSCDGILCTGETYKAAVKLTFAKGASLADPKGLFNSSLEGATRRALDLREGDKLDGPGLTALVREAVALNRAGKSAAKAPKAKPGLKQSTKR
ncbi:MAG: DUF1801 domain-containing protein [Candidatus Eisenbacteria bacterium]|uniref:DUF1801 domain-containing protein n=1 Tax=Eiseniibacteriota bacterium TaxID=2212470 RepID=A0A933W8L4_UNCEI|nr:DUF1801 domain-containing protein [Candidatus Eisenbacteria bacterium]